MKKTIRKITSTLLAIVLLFSTLSFTVATHYCGDFVVDVSYNGIAKGCDMDADLSSTATEGSCCKDELHFIEGQQELQKQSLQDFSFEQNDIAGTAPTHCYLHSQKVTLLEKNSFYGPPPPKLSKNFQILYQTFLI